MTEQFFGTGVIVCKECERVFRTTTGHLALDAKNYVCDKCKMYAARPRALRSQHIKVIQPWDAVEDQFCKECGNNLWVRGYIMMIDREVIVTYSMDGSEMEEVIKAQDQPIYEFHCANPDCPVGWGKDHRDMNVPGFMRPPWGKIGALEIENPPLFEGLTDEQKMETAHRIWWSKYLRDKRTSKDAGKGTDFSDMGGEK